MIGGAIGSGPSRNGPFYGRGCQRGRRRTASPFGRAACLVGVAHVLRTGANAISVEPALIPRARAPIDRMLAFTQALRAGTQAQAALGAWVPHMGAA